MQSHELNMSKWLQLNKILNEANQCHRNEAKYHNVILVAGRLLAENIIVMLLQYIGLAFTLLVTPLTPIWLAAGTATAFMFMRGYSIIPGIWIGTLLAYAPVDGLDIAILFACTFAFQSAMLLYFNHRIGIPTLTFSSITQFIKFAFITGLITLLCVSTFPLLAKLLIHLDQFPKLLWLHWWVADCNGILTISTAIIAWDTYFPDLINQNRFKKFILALSLLPIMILTSTLMLTNTYPYTVLIALTAYLFFMAFYFNFNYFTFGLAAAAMTITTLYYMDIKSFTLPLDFVTLLLCISCFISKLSLKKD